MEVSELQVQLDSPLTKEQLAETQRLRIDWLRTYNQLKNTPGGGYRHAEALILAEECLTIIDALLAANVTNH